VNDSSFVDCKSNDGSSDGGICTERNLNHDFSLYRLNFSDCRTTSNSWGVILYWRTTAGFWSFSECTVTNCYGGSGLDNQPALVPRVESSYFYNNTFFTGGGLLSGATFGFEVDRCIFNANGREFQMDTRDPLKGFRVTNCVLSGAFPGGDIYLATPDNLPNTQTEPFAFAYEAADHCPNALATAPVSESPKPTQSESPRETAAPSPTETDAKSPTETDPKSPTETDPKSPTGTDAKSPKETAEPTPERSGEATSARSEFVVPSTPLASPGRSPSGGNSGKAGGQSIPIIAGSIGVVVVIVAVIVAIVVCRRPAKSEPTSQLETRLTQLPTAELESHDFDQGLGLETENPMAQTIAPRDDDPDSGPDDD
jgi:hypothetical protein